MPSRLEGVDRDKILIPRDDSASFRINLQAFAPFNHSLQLCLISETDLDVGSFDIDLSGELWLVLRLVVEIEDEDAVDATSNQQVHLIVELSMGDQTDDRKVHRRIDHDVVLVDEHELEVVCDDQE